MIYQHDFTTKEQALRLKAAGLPAETADCMLTICDEAGNDDLVTLISEKGEAGENWDYFMDEDMFPCWSLGRLIELATYLQSQYAKNHLAEDFGIKIFYDATLIDDMVCWFERAGEGDIFDFSCLLPDNLQPKPETKRVENCAIRYFGDPCPINNGIEVDIYNCTNCEHYFATASKSIICKKLTYDQGTKAKNI